MGFDSDLFRQLRRIKITYEIYCYKNNNPNPWIPDLSPE